MMIPAPEASAFDIVIVGSGLGAAAAARGLALQGQRVAIVPGVGRSRSLESDGGLVDARLVEQAFGVGAPLGQTITSRQGFVAENVESSPHLGAIEAMSPRSTFRRVELEIWARDRAVAAGAVYLEGFIEGKALPLESGHLMLVEEEGEASLSAATIVLCEGSDPRIAMRVGLRPDYSPEEQIHFARAILAQPQTAAIYRSGRSRTSWGMPIGVTVVPMGATTLVSVDTRIENVMRAMHSTQEALLELLSSRLGAGLQLEGERIHTGIELSAVRSHARGLRLSHDRLLVGLDACGLMDTREPRRADVTIRSGMHLASYLTAPRDLTWDAYARPMLSQIQAINPRWHDSHGTGFVEETESTAGLFGPVSHLGKNILGRWRRRA